MLILYDARAQWFFELRQEQNAKMATHDLDVKHYNMLSKSPDMTFQIDYL